MEVVLIGKQLLMTRGSLTTFSIANDIAKYLFIAGIAAINMAGKIAKYFAMSFAILNVVSEPRVIDPDCDERREI
jgi:high-affinity K+ transport system ATPase subunit B